MRKDERGYLVLSTGRVLDANHGILGLSADEDFLYEGYDGILEGNRHEEDEPLTAEERKEIALYMIDVWTKWGAKEIER